MCIKGDNMKNNTNWSKTLLGIYRYLPRVTYAYDNLVKSRAYNSSATNSFLLGFNDIMKVANTIINLTERKNNLINLKVLTDKVLCDIDLSSAKILVMKFIDGKKSNEIANLLHLGKRTYFRKLNFALESFANMLTRLNYTDYKLENMIKDEKWILRLYNSYSNRKINQTENIMDNFYFRSKFQRNLMYEIKKVGVC